MLPLFGAGTTLRCWRNDRAIPLLRILEWQISELNPSSFKLPLALTRELPATAEAGWMRGSKGSREATKSAQTGRCWSRNRIPDVASKIRSRDSFPFLQCICRRRTPGRGATNPSPTPLASRLPLSSWLFQMCRRCGLTPATIRDYGIVFRSLKNLELRSHAPSSA